MVATEIWGEQLRNRKVTFTCDNLGVVQVVNSQSVNFCPTVRLLRHLVFKGLELNAQLTTVLVPVVCNSIADFFSRFQGERFWELVLGVDIGGIPKEPGVVTTMELVWRLVSISRWGGI